MNISLCGCGFLGIYHLGVAACLRKHGQGFLKSVDKVGGASAGGLVGLVLVVGQDKIEDCVKFTYDLAEEISSKKLGALTPGFSLLTPLKTFLETMIPEDAYKKATDKLYLSLTNVGTNKNEIVSKYSSNEELIQYLIASSFIPFYAGIRPININGQKYKDGGFTDNLLIFPEGRTVLISPFCGRQDISPNDKVGKGYYVNNNNQIFQINKKNIVRGIHAMFPPSKRVLENYYCQGYKDAERFLKTEGFYDKEEITLDFSKFDFDELELSLSDTDIQVE